MVDPKPSEQKTVLIVDDSGIVLEVAKRALERAGYRVITRDRPSGSVAAIIRERPDVVLLDVKMPTLTGDMLAKILTKVIGPETLVLLHSSLPVEALRLKALSTGAHGYIQKTENATEFVRRIEYWMGRRLASSSGRVPAAAGAALSTEELDRLEAAEKGERGERQERIERPAGTGSGGLPSSGRFRVSAPERPPFRSSSGQMPAASPASGPRLLFIDDDWAMLEAYRRIIDNQYPADYVATGEDALGRILSDSPPDIVVCDILVPGLSGEDLYRRAVAVDPSFSDRFIFVTGAASTRMVAEFLNGVEARVFHKPVTSERLLQTIQQIGSRVPRRREL